MKIFNKDIKNIFPGLLAAFLFCTVLTHIYGTCCPMRIITGLPCPACGTTRSVIALLKFDFKTAFWYQPVMPLLVLFCIFFCYKRYYKKQTDKRLFLRILGIILVICCSVYIYRMFKYFPLKAPLDYNRNNIINSVYSLIKTNKTQIGELQYER